MRRPFALLVALVFTVQALTGSLWVICQAPGPDGHERMEFALAGCCLSHDAHHTEKEGADSAPCMKDPNCCGPCVDVQVQQPPSTAPSHHDLVLPCAVPSPLPVLDLAFIAPLESVSPPDHPGDPPLFLTHCNFRI